MFIKNNLCGLCLFGFGRLRVAVTLIGSFVLWLVAVAA
jgi:hypothetical protein